MADVKYFKLHRKSIAIAENFRIAYIYNIVSMNVVMEMKV